VLTLRTPLLAAGLFVLLSGADLILTCLLLQHPGGSHYEANWLAGQILSNYDFVGLAAYKGLMVLVFGALVFVVARYRPAAARRLGSFACLAVGVVVLYSTVLLARQGSDTPTSTAKDLATVQREERDVESVGRRQAAFSALLNRWRKEVASGRGCLADAVKELTASDQAARFARTLRIQFGSPGNSDVECTAALVLRGALGLLSEDGSASALARGEQLLKAYQATYGSTFLKYVLEEFSPPPVVEQARPVPVAAVDGPVLVTAERAAAEPRQVQTRPRGKKSAGAHTWHVARSGRHTHGGDSFAPRDRRDSTLTAGSSVHGKCGNQVAFRSRGRSPRGVLLARR
jgi:hypothetical protein